jgi:hypothetical protein
VLTLFYKLSNLGSYMLDRILLPIPEVSSTFRYFISGILFVWVGLGFAYVFFQAYLGIATLLLVTIACTPLIFGLVMKEEKIEYNKKNFMHHYWDVLRVMLWLFAGMTASFIAAFLLVPSLAIPGVGATLQQNLIYNFQLLFLCVALSFLYGSGAILLLTYSAATLASHLVILPTFTFIGGVGIVAATLLEATGYICAGFASGIIGLSIAKHHFTTKHARKVLGDVGLLYFYAILLIIGSAILYAFV